MDRSALHEFRQFLRVRGLIPTDQELEDALAGAREQYSEGKYRLNICTAQPCCARNAGDKQHAIRLRQHVYFNTAMFLTSVMKPLLRSSDARARDCVSIEQIEEKFVAEARE
jgi:hypothetical protein